MLALESGSTLGRYTLLLPVGQGGQAAVWVASFTGLAGFEKTVAVKTLLPPRDDEEAHIERFTDEALLATRLRHPNVVEVLDFGEEDGVLYLVMPWIDGEPVNAIIDVAAKKGGIPIPIAVNLVGQACRGLHAAHELTAENGEPLGLVHRDVSPENILVTREGVAKIADFGVATARGHHSLITGESDLGRARGKVWYMAPEELFGEPVDRRADLFALGVVLYRMTTGRHPFGSDGDRKAVRRLLASSAPASPRGFLPDYPEALEAILTRVLAENPEERHASALELRQALFKAVPPASDDDVALFLAELFSGRRLERDERLREALDSRPGVGSIRPSGTDPERHDAERPSVREPAGRRFALSPARFVGFGLAGVLLAAFVTLALVRHGEAKVTLPTVEAKVVGGSAPAVAAEPVEPIQPAAAPALAARGEARATETVTLDEKAQRSEKSSIDVSPVREVGF